MENTELVESLKTSHNLNDNLPNSVLFPKLFFVLMLADALEHISIICELHHNAIKRKVRIFRLVRTLVSDYITTRLTRENL